MDLNGLEFTASQLTELYGASVFVMDADRPGKPAIKKEIPSIIKETIPFKGKNKKRILWVVYEPEQSYLSDTDFDFLSQIITACKMNMDDVALINAATKDFSVAEVLDQLNPVTLIFCGVPHTFLPFPINEYILYPHQKRNYFVCDSLNELQHDKVKKSKLWLVLKEILAI